MNLNVSKSKTTDFFNFRRIWIRGILPLEKILGFEPAKLQFRGEYFTPRSLKQNV